MRSSLFALVFLGASLVFAAPPRELSYRLEHLNNALSSTLFHPGAAGTGRCLQLTHQRGDWSRFNWPLFKAVPGVSQLRFFCRNDKAEPMVFTVRVLLRNGSEWACRNLAVEGEWKEFVLGAADFSAYRGIDKKTGRMLKLGEVMQFQIVPASKGKDIGTFYVDEISFSPGGPSWTAEASEERVSLSPVELERQRLEDLIGRWRYERRKLERDTQLARQWLEHPERQPVYSPEALPPVTYRLPEKEFKKKLSELENRPITSLPIQAAEVKAKSSVLYAAIPQAKPTRETDPPTGKSHFRQNFKFTGEKTRQTIFFDLNFTAPVNLEGRILELELRRSSDKPLNETFPFLVRLWVENEEGLEAWADFPPSQIPDRNWKRVSFNLARPLRGVRFNPQKVIGISLRLENVPGQEDDFFVDLGEARLLWPSALEILFSDLLNQELDLVHQARQSLYELRDLLAAKATGVGFQQAPAMLADVPRKIWVSPAIASPTLRHRRRHNEPDWSIFENGRPWFQRMTCYNGMAPHSTEWLIRNNDNLFAELWVDGMRKYGMFRNPGAWDACEEFGVDLINSLGANCKGLQGWMDIPVWRQRNGFLVGLVREHRLRPFQAVVQSGNEIELSIWGASLEDAFPGALYQPLDMHTEALKRDYGAVVPVMYVRAGRFKKVPPLPYEDICGVNQYTGRYGGRTSEIDRALAELSREASFCNRPVMITEWMGPKYSWAGNGIGGVTRRGAAYYLERYWRAMINTPGIVGSSEFTLNWVIAPFEDLTTQTREKAWENRPRHAKFGGGHTADHVPCVEPQDRVEGPCYRSMQAFHGPLYLMVNNPGKICLVQRSGAGRSAAEKLGAMLAKLGKTIEIRERGSVTVEADNHYIFLDFPSGEKAGIRWQLEKEKGNTLHLSLHAESAQSAQADLKRLLESAAALVELNEQEGAMGRLVALIDAKNRRAFSNYLLEFASRGYFFGGDDWRESLDPAEFLRDGKRRPAWADLSTVILDTRRVLAPEELALIFRLAREGVHIFMSLPCYRANPELQSKFPAKIGSSTSLAADFSLADKTLKGPIPLTQLGGAKLEVVEKFAPRYKDSPALRLAAITASGARPLATNPDGQAVAVAWKFGTAQVILFGGDLGEIVRIHRRTTTRGETHPLYDRNTACKLERISRFVVNCCRLDRPARRPRPRLFIETMPDSTIVADGDPLKATIRLVDSEGKPVSGAQLRLRTRRVVDSRGGASGDYYDVKESAPGTYRIVCPMAGDSASSAPNYPKGRESQKGRLHIVSFQMKAYANGYIPADGALAFALKR